MKQEINRTKSPIKFFRDEACINCKHAGNPDHNNRIACNLTKRINSWSYCCKKWEEIE